MTGGTRGGHGAAAMPPAISASYFSANCLGRAAGHRRCPCALGTRQGTLQNPQSQDPFPPKKAPPGCPRHATLFWLEVLQKASLLENRAEKFPWGSVAGSPRPLRARGLSTLEPKSGGPGLAPHPHRPHLATSWGVRAGQSRTGEEPGVKQETAVQFGHVQSQYYYNIL